MMLTERGHLWRARLLFFCPVCCTYAYRDRDGSACIATEANERSISSAQSMTLRQLLQYSYIAAVICNISLSSMMIQYISESAMHCPAYSKGLQGRTSAWQTASNVLPTSLSRCCYSSSRGASPNIDCANFNEKGRLSIYPMQCKIVNSAMFEFWDEGLSAPQPHR